MSRDFTTVGVLGLGTMGTGIVEVFARRGLQVVAVEPSEDGLERGRAHLQSSTGRAVRRGKLSEQERAAIFERIDFTMALDSLAEADLVVEAVPEQMDLKREVFEALDRICNADAILATNTSSLSVTRIAVTTARPGQVVGMHFFNPAPLLALVEVVRTVVSEAGVVDDVVGLARELGKTPVVIADRAGFIANALLFGYLNHAASMYQSRFATRADLDAAMTLGAGLRMGPLALLDLIGLDTSLSILETMYAESRDPLHAAAPVLRQMVTAGLLGRKSGRGFYTYESAGSPVVVDDAQSGEAVPGSARPGARDASRVGVVGPSAEADRAGGARRADRLAGALTASGFAVRRLAGSRQDLTELADCDVVIEAVEEDATTKRELFQALDAVCRPGAVLATTTSVVPVTCCAAATARPRDVVGLHLVDVAPGEGIVEIVRTVDTAPDVIATAQGLCERLGRRSLVCDDRAGFVVGALLVPHLNDAIRMLDAGYATVDDIDTAMKAGCGYPRGPFEMLDAIGLDVALSVERAIYREFREPGYAPAPLLERLVAAGHVGRRTGRGFRQYTNFQYTN